MGAEFVIGILLVAYFGFKGEPFFPSVLSILFTGYGANIMTFMVVWVLFHNLVYIL